MGEESERLWRPCATVSRGRHCGGTPLSAALCSALPASTAGFAEQSAAPSPEPSPRSRPRTSALDPRPALPVELAGNVSPVSEADALHIDVTEDQLAAVSYNRDGLVPAIVQEASTGEVLMLAWMNEDTLRETLRTGRTVFWSRSRQERWRKGDTSGDHQWVRRASYDCDGDTLLFVVDQDGAGACHTGRRSCFYRHFGAGPAAEPA
jgi:phosphoribosyl-AMP cyclohydrolase